MANLNTTIARLRALSKREQEALAAQIDLLLDGGDLLAPGQWAAVEARLDSSQGLTPHEEVVKAFRARAG